MYKLKLYALKGLVSENNLTKSWQAVNLSTNRKCFIKAVSEEGDLDAVSREKVILRSYDGQRQIKSNYILSATGKHRQSGTLFIEYPYLDQSVWRKMNQKLFWKNFPQSIIQICLIIDYLHIFNLVHCDLKLENFEVNADGKYPPIILIDLDFLTPSYKNPDAKIFGTPEHIAPEILENRKIVIQSDNYSFGILLKSCIKYLKKNKSEFNTNLQSYIDNLIGLSDALTLEDYALRPRLLIRSLMEYNIIDSENYKASLRTVFARQLITNYWKDKNTILADEKGFGDFLLVKNRIFGIDNELVSDFYRLVDADRRAFFDLFKDMIDRAVIEISGDYWHIKISDDLLEEIYQNDKMRMVFEPIFAKDPKLDSNPGKLLKYARDLLLNRDKSNPRKTYLCLKATVNKLEQFKDKSLVSERRKLLLELGDLATLLNRPEEANNLYIKALELSDNQSGEDGEILYKLVFRAVSMRQFDKASQWIKQGLEKTKDDKSGSRYLNFLRQKAWLISQKGDHDRAKKILEDIRNKAIKTNNSLLLMNVYHDRGLVEWRMGNFLKAQNYLRKNITIAEREGHHNKLISAYGNLALLNYEISQYKKAVAYGKAGLKYAGRESDYINLNGIYNTIAVSYSRLNRSHKSFFWLQKMIDSASHRNDPYIIIQYLSCRGAFLTNLGEFSTAKESLLKVLDLGKSDVLLRNTGKVYFNLAEIAFNEGDYEKCSDFVEKSKSALGQLGDSASVAELDLIGTLSNMYYSGKKDNANLLNLLNILIGYNCLYYASLCLFHLLMHADIGDASAAAKIALPLRPLFRKGEVPLFKALAEMLTLNQKILSAKILNIGVLKNIYKIFDNTGCKFEALLICMKIAEYYVSAGKNKLAGKFYGEARNLAENIGNLKMANAVSEIIKKTLEDNSGQKKVIDTVYKISKILKNIKDYENALELVIQFIVDETGAERGVLLLRADDKSDNFRVRSFVNCDESSFKDIIEISQSVPKYVSQSAEPLIINDAVNDKRTNRYKSIIVHNIRSVICIPITVRDKATGVLYLDHHTIPGLFEREDIIFVMSVANFISVMLSTIQDYRNVDVARRQLMEDIDRLGVKHTLITKNERMLDLLSKIPEIARTNASVLIVGESGTGKEILCEMIHSFSLRSNGPLIKLNCAAVPNTLIESELFGIAKNTASGVDGREGKFSAADGGTLFLDEIGDMPPEVQAKILRVLEYQEFEKVGSNRTIATDIRFIYATNKNLRRMIKDGKFRDDLFHRITTIVIEIPPLRERLDDLPELIEHFMSSFSHDKSRRPKMSSDVIKHLFSYRWPGNIRELRNIIERYCILYAGKAVRVEDLPDAILNSNDIDSANTLSTEAGDKVKIKKLLQIHNWNQSKVARILKIPLSTFRRKLKKYNISKNK